jgi:hypothetical protein
MTRILCLCTAQSFGELLGELSKGERADAEYLWVDDTEEALSFLRDHSIGLFIIGCCPNAWELYDLLKTEPRFRNVAVIIIAYWVADCERLEEFRSKVLFYGDDLLLAPLLVKDFLATVERALERCGNALPLVGE